MSVVKVGNVYIQTYMKKTLKSILGPGYGSGGDIVGFAHMRKP